MFSIWLLYNVCRISKNWHVATPFNITLYIADEKLFISQFEVGST